MRKLLLLSVLAVGSVYGDIIPNLQITPGGVVCGLEGGLPSCTFNYTATLHQSAKLTNETPFDEYFTIYDFNGYIDGSAVAPAGWQVVVNGSGWTPSLINISSGTTPADEDDSRIPNLTFVYTGGADIAGGMTFTGFSAKSFNGPSTVPDYFASQATKGPGDNEDSQVQNVGFVDVPNPEDFPGDVIVPEPMSMALLGGGLLAIAVLPRRFKK